MTFKDEPRVKFDLAGSANWDNSRWAAEMEKAFEVMRVQGKTIERQTTALVQILNIPDGDAEAMWQIARNAFPVVEQWGWRFAHAVEGGRH